MAINDDLNKTKQSADEAKQSVDGLNDSINKSNQESSKLAQNFSDVEKKIQKLNDLGTSSSSAFGDIGKALTGLARDSKDFSSQIADAAKSQRSLATNAQKLASFTKEDLKDKTKAKDFAKISAKIAGDRAKIESQIRVLQVQRVNAVKSEKAILDKTIENLRNGESFAKDIADGFDDINGANDKLNKNTKFFDNLEKTLKTIPGIGPAIAGPFSKASQAVRDARVDGEGLGSSLAKGGNEIAKSFGPAFFLGSLFKANGETIKLATTLGVSADEARDMRTEFASIAVNSGKSYLNAEKLAEAQFQLGESLGAQVGFTDDQIKNQVTLTKKLHLSAEEAANLNRYSVLTGKDTKKITTGILDNVAALEKETGIRLNGQKIVQEVAKVNGQLGAQYGFNTKKIAEAVIQAKKLGLTLEETKNIAGQLLDFESSIEAELEAELMTGKNLNLEQARLLALQGDSAGAVAEMAKQFGTAEEFSAMNVLQQQSLAKAVGMTADQLANSLRERETLNALGAENIKQLEEEGRLDELKGTKNGEFLLKQYQQQSAADKFQEAMVKIQSTIGTLVEGPLGGFIDGLASVLNSATAIKGIMVAIGVITAANFAKSILSITTQIGLQKALNRQNVKGAATSAVETAAEAGKSVSKIPVVGGFLAIGLMAGIIGYIMGQLSKAKSVGDISSPSMGKTMVSTKEGGLFELSQNDDLVAAPGAVDALNSATSPNTQESGNVSVSMQKLEQLQAQTNALLNKIAGTQGTVSLDAEKMGTAISMNTYEISP